MVFGKGADAESCRVGKSRDPREDVDSGTCGDSHLRL